ncbi:MAG: hypothetical protein O3A95_03860 [Planctomycetota bacterium]|nr:hypothetical protein [Planctomycetota bacterium]
MIDWISKQHIQTFRELPAAQRRRIWRRLYVATFQNPRCIFTFLLLIGAALAAILVTSLLTGTLFFVSFWLHWTVCGRLAYSKVEDALRSDGLLIDQTSSLD